MIYAIRAVGTDYIKFGYTSHGSAEARMKTLQTGCPFDLALEATCKGGIALEAWVHTRLRKAGLARRNEWFTYGAEARELVNLMKKDKLSEVERSGIGPTHRRLGKALQYAMQVANRLPDEHSTS
jgi:hypothetical protein